MTGSSSAALTTGLDRARVLRGKAWFWVPIVPLVVLDLWSKAAVFAFLSEAQPFMSERHRNYPVWSAFDGTLNFALCSWRNPGTIWGLGQNLTFLLIGVRVVALGVIAWFAWRAHRKAQLFVLGLIMAGAIGNLYDNLTQEGNAVRDFLLFYLQRDNVRGWTWPAFNVADACICVGAVSLALLLWRADAKPGRTG